MPIFGRIENYVLVLNAFGKIAEKCWHELPLHFKQVGLDAFIAMPSHVHGIIVIEEMPAGESTKLNIHDSRGVGAQHAAPVRPKARVVPGSLGAIVRSYKDAVTREIHRSHLNKDQIKVWHRNNYEHVIRDEIDLENTRRYILYNAQK